MFVVVVCYQPQILGNSQFKVAQLLSISYVGISIFRYSRAASSSLAASIITLLGLVDHNRRPRACCHVMALTSHEA